MKNRPKNVTLATLALALCASLPVGAASAPRLFEKGVSTPDVEAILREAGMPFLTDKDSTGDPRYKITCSGINTFIYSYNCAEGVCDTLQLSIALDKTDPVTFAVANEWNAKKLWGTAYVDEESDIWLQQPNLVKGATSNTVEQAVKHFCTVTVPDFLRHINW